MVQVFQQQPDQPNPLGQAMGMGLGKFAERMTQKKMQEQQQMQQQQQQSAMSRILTGEATEEDMAALPMQQQLEYAKIRASKEAATQKQRVTQEKEQRLQQHQEQALQLRAKEAELRARGFTEKANQFKAKLPDVVKRYTDSLLKDEEEFKLSAVEKARMNREMLEEIESEEGGNLAQAAENALQRISSFKEDVQGANIQRPGFMRSKENKQKAMLQIANIMNEHGLSEKKDFVDIAKRVGWKKEELDEMWNDLTEQVKQQQPQQALNREQADQILDEAGGDAEKARKLAQERGFAL